MPRPDQPTPDDVEELISPQHITRVWPGDPPAWSITQDWPVVGPITLVVAFTTPPRAPGALSEALEMMRRSRGADRALGVCLDGDPPATAPDHRNLEAISFHDLVARVDAPEQAARRLLASEARHRDPFVALPWRGSTRTEEPVELYPYVERWLVERERRTLLVIVPNMLREQLARGFALIAARAVPPISLDYERAYQSRSPTTRFGGATPMINLDRGLSYAVLDSLRRRRALVFADPSVFDSAESLADTIASELDFVQVSPFDAGELRRWFVAQQPASTRGRVESALAESDELAQLVDNPIHYPALLHAAREAFAGDLGTANPIAATAMAFVRRTLDSLDSWAFGTVDDYENLAWGNYLGQEFTGYWSAGREPQVEGLLADGDPKRFDNMLIRNCFVAMWLAREALLGRCEHLRRHRCPERDLQHHLRALLPERLHALLA